jgi:hypothetical protein
MASASAQTARTTRPDDSPVGRLAKFFPEAMPMRIPVHVSGNAGQAVQGEHTTIEYGTEREVLFAATVPLEFAEKVRLRNSDGSLDVDAWVVAVQYEGKSAAVAARFVHEVRNWVVKP